MSTVPFTIQLPVGPQGPPGPLGPPAIPLTAKNYGVLDNNPLWKWQHDDATPGTSVGTSSYGDAVSGRNFTFSETLLAGERFSTGFATDLSYPLNFCYDAEFMLLDPSQFLNLELDINQVLADGRTCIMDTQYASVSGSVEFDGWKPTRITGNPKQWGAGVWRRIRHFWHRSADGNTVTFDGAEKDGVYTAAGVSSTTRTKALGWGPPGLLLINVQVEGAYANGTVVLYGRNIQIWSW